MNFVPDRRPLRGRSGNRPPVPAMIVMVGVTLLFGLVFLAEQLRPGTIRARFPYGDSDFFWIGVIFFPMVALVMWRPSLSSSNFARQKAGRRPPAAS